MGAIYRVGFEAAGIGKTNSALKSTQGIAEKTKSAVGGTTAAFHAQKDAVQSLSSGVNVLGFSMDTLLSTLVSFDGRMQGAGKALEAFRTGFANASAEGQSFFEAGVAGFHAIRAANVSWMKVLMTSIAPLAAIGVAVFTLKKIWDNNIGGIQTEFAKIMGQLKQYWAQFEIAFIDGLRQLQPIFFAVFKGIAVTVQSTFKVLGGLFKGISAIVKPIIGAFSEIASIFAVFSSDAESGGQSMMKVFGAIGKVLEYLGKTIGFVVKMALKPIVFQFRMLAKGAKLVSDAWTKFKDNVRETSMFKAVISVFEKVRAVISKIISLINKIPGVSIPDEITSAVSGSNRQNQNVRNNNVNMNINTSRAIDGNSAPAFADMLAMQLDKNG